MSPLAIKRTTPVAPSSAPPPSPATTSPAIVAPVLAPTPPEEPEAPVEVSADETLDAARTDRAVGIHRRRRATLAVACTSAALGGLWLANHQTAPAPQSAHAASAVEQVTAVLEAAKSWQATHASFTGFVVSVPPSTRVAAWGPAMVVSSLIGGQCAYSGVFPSGVKPIMVDASRSACTDAAILRVARALHGATVSH